MSIYPFSRNYFPKTFPCITNVQAKCLTFSLWVNFEEVENIFDFRLDDPKRPQRKLKPSRVKQIARYLTEHNNDFVLPAVTAATPEMPEFVQSRENPWIGQITLTQKLFIHDGQHRLAGIVEFLQQYHQRYRKRGQKLYKHNINPDHAIPVTLFIDRGLARSKQIFADINKNAVKPSKTIIEKFDQRPEKRRQLEKIYSQVQTWLDGGYAVNFDKDGKHYQLVTDYGFYEIYKDRYTFEKKPLYKFTDLFDLAETWGQLTFFRSISKRDESCLDHDIDEPIHSVGPNDYKQHLSGVPLQLQF